MENTTSVPLQTLPRVSPDSNRPDNADNRDGTRSRASSMTAVHSVKTPDSPAPSHAFEIRRSYYGLLLAIVYAAFALPSWIITCWVSYRPVGGNNYRQTHSATGYYGYADEKHALYTKSERWFYAARVLQAITTIATLPLTSGICAAAAVIYMQRSRNLTLRQVMALADREWLPFGGNGRLILGGKKFGSWFLLFAFVLNLLGLIIAPLQAILVTSDTIKTPTEYGRIEGLVDLLDPTTNRVYGTADPTDGNLITAMTRNAIKSGTLTEVQSQLWAGAGVSCDPLSASYKEHKYSFSTNACRPGGATFDNMDYLPDPFLAELPFGSNTGLIRQFLPRINSTAHYQNITEEEYPRECQSIPNGFFVEYANTTFSAYGDNRTWGVQACMPGDVTRSPWQATRNRQDFSETLYLNVSQYGYSSSGYGGAMSSFYRLTMATTAGYFELPNYMNGGVAGELLENDPSDLCQSDCVYQGNANYSIGWNYHQSSYYDRRQAQVLTEPLESTYELGNRGPLLTLALALFGEGSFVASRARNPSAYATTILAEGEDDEGAYRWSPDICIDTFPLGWLFSAHLSSSETNACISNRGGKEEEWKVAQEIGRWLANFKGRDEDLSKTFTAAAFLANREWIKYRVSDRYDRTLTVSLDSGADTQVPSISLAGVIVISTLLGIHVLSLLALGLYSVWSPRWTSTLDSFAMMRMGADILPELPMHLSIGTHKVEVLDSAPGFVGDAAQGERVGKLGVGATAPIKSGRHFKAFHKNPVVHDPYRPPRR
ncbi:hypothetical protein BDW69DRAFT_160697 [Aspergillus filifer]